MNSVAKKISWVILFVISNNLSQSVFFTWYDQAEKIETNGIDFHMSIHEEGQYAHTIQ